MLFYISSKKIHRARKDRLKNFLKHVSVKYFSDKDKFTKTTCIYCFKEVGAKISRRFSFRGKGIWASHTLLSEDSCEF